MDPTKKSLKPFVKKPPIESSMKGARRYMAWLLARREYAASELRLKASQKGYDKEHIEDSLAFLQLQGYQNDNRYAGMKARQSASRWGDRHIAYALKAKEIQPEDVAAQISVLPDESERAWGLLGRFLGHAWDASLKQKVWQRLATRGFQPQTIKNALSRLQEELSRATDDN